MEAAEMEAPGGMEAQVYCLNCRSINVAFKYKNNKKLEQPRYMCLDCENMFTWGHHNRPKPVHYGKQRNQDPDHFRGLPTECSKCGTVSNSRFKYYNNKRLYGETQPRFQCLSCSEHFQMRFEGGMLMSVKAYKARSKTRPGINGTTVGEPCMAPAPSASCEYDAGSVEQVGLWSYYPESAACDYHMGNVDQVYGQCSNYTNDGQVLSEAECVEVDQSDGGQCSYAGEMVDTSAVGWSSSYIPNDHAAASASDFHVTVNNAEELGELFIPGDEVFFAATADPMEEVDVGKYSCAPEHDAVNVDQVDEYLVDPDAAEIEEGDGGGYPSYSEGMAAAAAALFSVPDDSEMYPLEDFEEDLDLSTIEEDAGCLWNLIHV